MSLALAQEKTVNGTVTDGVTGQPLPGANVSVKGTTTGTTTDMQGQYELTVGGPEAVLVFSFVGYQQQEVTVGDQTTINVTLQEDVEQLDEVVVVGYGTQRRSEVSGSVSSVDVAEANVGQNTSPEDLIRGRVAGVNIQDTNGEPGGGVNVRIRGTTSISAGSDPLYVIDNVPVNNTSTVPGGLEAGGLTASSASNPLALLNPNDIESIEILKDAAATAIYGSQGANGVILVTTKGGNSGDVRVNYSGKLSGSTLANPLNLLTGDEYRDARQEFLDNPGEQPQGDTDWQDEVYRTALTQNHNLSFSGGTEQTTYRASLGYLDQEGIILSSGLERLSGRINADHKLLDDRVRFNLNLTGAFTERTHVFYAQGAGFQGGTIKGTIGFDPRLPVRNPDGTFSTFSQSIRNPVAIEEQTDDNTDQTRILSNFSTEIDLTDDLTAKGLIGVDRSTALRRTYIPRVSELSPGVGNAQQSERELTNIVTQATLRYNRDLFDDHSITVLGGYEYKRETFREVGTSVSQFVTDRFSFNNLQAAAEVNKPTSVEQEVEQVSGFGRVNYNLGGKYLFEATTRVDGSSVFGDNNKFGVFPSGSIAWRVSEESFMEDIGWLTELKVRASYGLSGNQAVPPYQSLQLLRPNDDFVGVFGDNETEVVGIAQSNLANPDLQWEQTTTANLGVDFTAGRFDGSVEVYRKRTTDLLVVLPLPQPAAVGERLENAGELTNTGVEASLETFVIDRPDLSLNFGLNVASNRNIIQDLGELEEVITTPAQGAGQTGTNTQIIREGSPIGTFYGPEFVGVENGVQLYRTEDGGTTDNPNAAERKIIGNAVPDFTYGFNTRFRYKSVDANIFLRGSYGAEVFNNTALEFSTKSNLGNGFNVLEDALNDGVSLENSAPVYSSRWIEDASFLRVDNVTVGYTLPNADTYGLRNARVYVSAQNLWVFTPYDGYDPEVNSQVNNPILNTTAFRALSRPNVGVDYTNYPRSRTFTLGVEIGI